MAKSLKRTLPSLLTAITVICAIGLMVSGIFLHRISGTYSFLVGQEYHYSTTLGPALRLVVDPSVSLETMRVNYGLLFSITSAEVARLFHVSTFGGWVTEIQVFQIVFVGCALCAAWFLEQSPHLLLILLVALTPRFSSVDQTVIAAPTSGIRFLTFAILPLLLAFLLRTKSTLCAAIAGAAISIFVLWNPETGLPCAAALLFFVFVSELLDSRSFWRSLGLTCFAILVSCLLLTAGFAAIVGRIVSPHLFFEHFTGIFIGGYGGRAFWHEGMATIGVAMLCALYASSVVIHCCLTVRAQTADRRSIARASMAVAAIVWFGYFAQLPMLSKLYTVIVLLIFTVAPLIEDKRPWVPAAVWLFVFYVGVTYFASAPARFGFGEANFQGIILPEDTARYLNTEAAGLRSAPADTIYFSSAPFSMALASGRINRLKVFDPFGETWTTRSFIGLMQDVSAQHPACILLEAPNSPLLAVSPPRSRFIERIRSALPADYHFLRTDAGWEFGAANERLSRCPLWVINGHFALHSPCRLYPRKRTCAVH
jgi:hypothetical protein